MGAIESALEGSRGREFALSWALCSVASARSQAGAAGRRARSASGQAGAAGILAVNGELLSSARPRLLACDLDGTLLDPEGRIPRATRTALLAIRRSGVRVILASGRSPWSMREICQDLRLHGPQITMQGGLLISPLTGLATSARTMPELAVRAQLAFARAHGVDAVLGFPDGDRAERVPSDLASLFTPAVAEGRHFSLVPSLAAVAGNGVIRTFVRTPPGRHEEILLSARSLFGDTFSLVVTDERGVELLAPRTNKGEALHVVARRYGLGLDAVAAVGDGFNDLEMLAFAGHSAAMGQALPEVKARAQFVVPPNDEEGILEAFRRFYPELDLGTPRTSMPFAVALRTGAPAAADA